MNSEDVGFEYINPPALVSNLSPFYCASYNSHTTLNYHNHRHHNAQLQQHQLNYATTQQQHVFGT